MSSSYRQPWVKPIAGDVPSSNPSVYGDEFRKQNPRDPAYDPEFLVQPDAKWNTWDVGGELGFALIDPTLGMLVVSGGATKTWGGKYLALPVPAAGESVFFALTARALLGQLSFPATEGGAQFQMFGLVVAEDLATGPDSSPLWSVQNEIRAEDPGTQQQKLVGLTRTNSWAAAEGIPSGGDAQFDMWPMPYLRAVVSSENEAGVFTSNVTMLVSSDGLGWYSLCSYSAIDSAIRHAALALRVEADAEGLNKPGLTCLFDFLRYDELHSEVYPFLSAHRQQFGTV